MKLDQDQLTLLSHYFADISKVIVASVVIGFFVPIGVGPITLPVFAVGTLVAVSFLILSIRFVKVSSL